MVLGSTPAATRLLSVRPIAPLLGSNMPTPQPQSISTSLELVLMTCGLNGTVTMPFGIYAASAAASASAFGTLRTKVSGIGNEREPSLIEVHSKLPTL